MIITSIPCGIGNGSRGLCGALPSEVTPVRGVVLCADGAQVCLEEPWQVGSNPIISWISMLDELGFWSGRATAISLLDGYGHGRFDCLTMTGLMIR